MLLIPLSCCERLDDGLLIFAGDRLVMLIMATSLFCQFPGVHNVQESTGVLPQPNHAVETGYL